MASRKIDGIVVKVTEYGESDKIITLYSSEKGTFIGIAKGAKRSTKRFVNKLEIFSHLECIYNDKYTLPIIEQAELLNSHLPLRNNFRAYTAAILICETLYSWAPENDVDPELFNSLRWALDTLCGKKQMQQTVILFLARLYTTIGYRPDLSACSMCSQLSHQKAPFSFQTSSGSIICNTCREESSAIPLSLNTIKLLSKACDLPLDKLSRLHFSKESINESLKLFRLYGRYLLDRDIHSWSFFAATL